MLQLLVYLVVLGMVVGCNLVVSSINKTFGGRCLDFDCGDGVTLGYPFWPSSVASRSGYYCGYKGFGISCPIGRPVLSLSSRNISYPPLDFWVKNINNSDGSLTVVDLQFREHKCDLPPAYYYVGDVLFGDFFYALSDNEIINVYGNCSLYHTSAKHFSCGDSNDPTSFYFLEEAYQHFDWNRKCEAKWEIPVFLEATNNSDSVSDLLSNFSAVSLSLAIQKGFKLRRRYYDDPVCKFCEKSGGRCGDDVSISGGLFVCICSNGSISYNADCITKVDGHKGIRDTGGRVKKKVIMIGVFAGFGSLILIILFASMMKYSSTRRKTSNTMEVFLEDYGQHAPQRYKYSDIKKITNSFQDKLGQGGYGGVFKGKLKDGCYVAVKVLNESKGNGEEFMNEVATIGRTNHINIVSLLGFCSDGSKRALVYEFMPNGSLEKFIYNEKSTKETNSLGAEKLYQIALGIANGLEYLHRGCKTRILHFDIKPHNILLDKDFCPKISDFGLAKLCPTREGVVSMLNARGTIGYIAPEVYERNFEGVSSKSDVYSYGMMLLEMVGGRKNIDATVDNISEIYFPRWIYNHMEVHGNGGLRELNEKFEEESIRKMIIVGLWCIQKDPTNRPSMSTVIEMLQKSVDDLPTPSNPFLDLRASSSQECRINEDNVTEKVEYSHGSVTYTTSGR